MMKAPVQFILFSTAAAVVYGVAHDLVTAHLWLPYFTVHHPRLVASDSPIVLALLWGVVATWWVGAIGGALLAAANSVGTAPSLDWTRLRRWTSTGLIVLFAGAMGVIFAIWSIAGTISPSDRRSTFEEDRLAVAVALAHVWSYAGAVALGVGLTCAILVARRRAHRKLADPPVASAGRS